MFTHMCHTYVLVNCEKEGHSTLKTSGMKLKDIMLSKMGQTEKEKYSNISLICGIKKKVDLIKIESSMLVSEENGEILVKTYKL